jgi:hypothetical protein
MADFDLRYYAVPQVASIFGTLVRSVDGAALPPGAFFASAEDINVLLAGGIEWAGGGVPGQMRVPAAAQKAIFESAGWRTPTGDAQRISWQCRMDRLATEVRWELANRAGRSGTYKRSARDVLERGYELAMDLDRGSVVLARQLGVREWNAARQAEGLPLQFPFPIKHREFLHFELSFRVAL